LGIYRGSCSRRGFGSLRLEIFGLLLRLRKRGKLKKQHNRHKKSKEKIFALFVFFSFVLILYLCELKNKI
jgi:hypothetical protein